MASDMNKMNTIVHHKAKRLNRSLPSGITGPIRPAIIRGLVQTLVQIEATRPTVEPDGLVELEMASARSPCIIPDAHHITAVFQLHLPQKSGLPSALFLPAETSKNDSLLI